MSKSIALIFTWILCISILHVFTVQSTTPHTITVDGLLGDWSSDECLGSSQQKKAYITWDAQNLYFAWEGTDFGTEGDLFIYLNTTAGGSYTSKDWYGTHSLPFDADYLFWVENGAQSTNYGLDRYTNGWNTASFTGTTYIGWTDNKNTEISIPLTDIGSPAQISVLIFSQYEDAQNVWCVFPLNNTLTSSGSQTFTYYYQFPLTTGITPNSSDYIKVISSNDTQPPIIKFLA
ncbi:MAG: hypothetical protein ACPL1Y_06570, partial [Thermoplasmata archaeon]